MAIHKGSSHNTHRPKTVGTRTSTGQIRAGGTSQDVAVRMPRDITGQSKKGHGNPHQQGR